MFNSSTDHSINMTYTTGLLGNIQSDCVLTTIAEDAFNDTFNKTKYNFSESV